MVGILYRWAKGEKDQLESQEREVQELKAQVARIPEIVEEQV